MKTEVLYNLEPCGKCRKKIRTGTHVQLGVSGNYEHIRCPKIKAAKK